MKMFTKCENTNQDNNSNSLVKAFIISYMVFLIVVFVMGYICYHLLSEDALGVRYLAIYCLCASVALGVFLTFFIIKNKEQIAHLNERLDKAMVDNNMLAVTVEAAGPALFQSRINKILGSSIISADEAAYTREYLGLTDDNLSYYVLYCVTYGNDFIGNPTENIVYDDNDRAVFNNYLYNMLKEAFSYNGNLYYYYAPTSRTYSVIVPFIGNSSEMVIKIQEKILNIHRQVLDQYSLWFFAGLGTPCKYDRLWESFEQARQMAGKAGRDYIFSPYEVAEKDSRSYFYPTEFSTQMTHFITIGKQDQVRNLFNLIQKENMQERSLSVQLTRYLISDVRNSILKARFAVSSENVDDALALNEIDHVLASERLTFALLEDSALKLCNYFTPKKTETSSMESIVEYISCNYKDPSMGLNLISDKFNISESYFSHMFKEAMGVNFSVYLEDMRLTEASRMIEAKEGSLSDIAEAVGYNSIASFRRAFKKKYGVTPGSLV